MSLSVVPKDVLAVDKGESKLSDGGKELILAANLTIQKRRYSI